MTQSGSTGLGDHGIDGVRLPDIDRWRLPHYIGCMSKPNKLARIEQELSQLEARIDTLLKIIERLSLENRSLRAQQEGLVTERASLIERRDLVRNRVEAIVTRLKSLETGT